VIPNQQEDHAVNPTLVLLNDLAKPFGRELNRFRDWLQGCGQCCSQCSLHLYSLRLWIWTNLLEEGLHGVDETDFNEATAVDSQWRQHPKDSLALA
jgi:hypothetical protein